MVAQSLAQLVIRELNPKGRLAPAMSARRILRRGQHLYRPGDRPAYVYSIHRGALKTYRASHDGSEWIAGFHFPEEVLGLEALLDRPMRCGAVALDTVMVCLIPVPAILECLGRSEAMRLQLFRSFGDEIERLEEHMSLDALSAERRMAAFILWAVDTFSDHSSRPTLSLPMSQKEIGNYLRLVPETVSRLLARFQERGWLSLRRRNLRVRNLEQLRRAATGEAGDAAANGNGASHS